MPPKPRTVSKWQKPDCYLTAVVLYLFLLAASAIAYVFWVYDWLVSSSIATAVLTATATMIVTPAFGGILLLWRGATKTAFTVSLAALLIWELVMAGVAFGALNYLGNLTLLYYIAPLPASLPFLFPLAPSLVMIGLLVAGWKKMKSKSS